MAPDGGNRAQLEWEARWGRPASYAAFAAAALLLTSFLYRVTAVPPAPARRSEAVVQLAAQSSNLLFFTLLQAGGFLCSGAALYYLYRAVRHRRAATPAASGVLALAGPAAIALGGVAAQVVQASAASAFVAGGPRTDARALELLDSDLAEILAYGTLGGALAFAFASVLISANGLQAGLLSRFLGILGVILGFLYVLPIPPGPTVIQIVWFAALGGLLAGRWPGGRGPAWESGEAERWESPAERRAREKASDAGSPAVAPPESPASGPRKRKRRSR